MKPLNLLKVISTLLVYVLVASSCTTTKKTALSCPEFPSYKSKVALNHNRNNKKFYAFTQRANKRSSQIKKHTSTLNNSQKKSVNSLNELNKNPNNYVSSVLENASAFNKIEYTSNLHASINTATIPINPSYSLTALSKYKVSEYKNDVADFSYNDIKYNKIDFINIPVNSISVSNNTYLKNFNILVNSLLQENAPKKVQGLGLAGFITSLAGLLILAVPCGLVGTILSGIGLSKILKEPDKYSGKGFAIAGLAVGIVDIVLGIIIIAGAV